MDPVDRLLARIERARRWPIPAEAPVRKRIGRWIALRESIEAALRKLADWPSDRGYVIDNLPAKIAEAYGMLLFGQDPEGRAGVDADAERLQDLLEAASLPSDLQAAEETRVSEGEVWWRLSVQPDASPDHPIPTFHSRYDVVPLLHGRHVVACAFVTKLGDPAGQRSQVVYRHLEIHGRDRMVNRLYRGREHALGQPVPLESHPEVAELPDEWIHDLGRMLGGRIVNRYGRDPRAGVSIYEGIWQQFLVLNEATTIGRENMRLTAKKRALLPASLAGPRRPQDFEAGEDRGDGSLEQVPRATVDLGEDVLFTDPLDVEEGRENAGPFKVLEYSFDAAALISYMVHVTETICQRCDIVPQFIGGGEFGGAGDSGVALRVRLLPTVGAAEASGRRWDDQLPIIVETMQLLEALPIAAGGLGREWSDPAARPTIERADPLPEDPAERDRRHADLKTADLISTRQSVRERNPGWTDQQVDAEVDAIREDVQATAPAATFGGGGPSGDPPPPPEDAGDQ